MGEVERNRDTGNAIGREPVGRQPDVRAKLNSSAVQFIVEPQHTGFEATSLYVQGQFRYAEIKELVVRKPIEVDSQNLRQPFPV